MIQLSRGGEDVSENKKSRVQRNKTKNNRSDLILKLSIGLLAMALIILMFEFFYPGSNQDPEGDILAGMNQQEESSSIIASSNSPESIETKESESEAKKEESKEESKEKPKEEPKKEDEIIEVASDDPNVIKAYSGQWEPVETNQGGPHVTNYDDGSADRIEIRRATSQVTGVSEDDMIEYWVGSDGGAEDQVTSTILETSTQRYYKVYLTWNDGQGWQVTRYEEIQDFIQ